MDEAELQELRKKQVEQMQREAQLREILRKILDPKAFERLMNIRISNRELYMQLAQLLVYAYQQGQLPAKVSETELLSLLNRIKAGEKQTSITIKRK
ncbi:MAG TPA: DNA-binding protein [Candidatus Norongarragalinales archaeon]|nr:DNA-binding protein [Candidatus Norongarragalinales archaeon]